MKITFSAEKGRDSNIYLSVTFHSSETIVFRYGDIASDSGGGFDHDESLAGFMCEFLNSAFREAGVLTGMSGVD